MKGVLLIALLGIAVGWWLGQGGSTSVSVAVQRAVQRQTRWLAHSWRKVAQRGWAAVTPSPASSGEPSARKVFSVEELRRYTGTDGQPIFLAIMGAVYDVSAGPQHYGPDGGYAHFAGTDASAAFVTGKFEGDGLTSSLDGLTPEQVVAVYEWKTFYDEHAEYRAVGVLADRYYDESGAPTDELRDTDSRFAQGMKLRADQEAFRRRWPPCNFRSAADNPKVEMWCADNSGGIARGWDGYPRELFDGSRADGAAPRCACVQVKDFDHPNLREYEDCDRYSPRCFRLVERAKAVAEQHRLKAEKKNQRKSGSTQKKKSM